MTRKLPLEGWYSAALYYVGNAMGVLRNLALILLIAIGSKLLYDADRTVRSADAAVREAQTQVRYTAQNVNAALLQLGLTADELRRASSEERGYYKSMAEHGARSMRDLDRMIRRTDANVNDTLLPSLAGSVAQGSSSTTALLKETTASLSLLTQDSHELLARASERVGDPEIERTVRALAVTTENVQKSTEHIEHATGDIERKVHAAVRPASLAVRIGSAVLGVFVKLFSVLAK